MGDLLEGVSWGLLRGDGYERLPSQTNLEVFEASQSAKTGLTWRSLRILFGVRSEFFRPEHTVSSPEESDKKLKSNNSLKRKG